MDVDRWGYLSAYDESLEFLQINARGKIHIIKIDCWNEVIMKGKKDTKLSDYPLRLLRVQVCKASGELLFKRPLWLTAAGRRRMELSLSDIFLSYRQRFDNDRIIRVMLIKNKNTTGSGGLGHAHGLGLVLDRWVSKVQNHDPYPNLCFFIVNK